MKNKNGFITFCCACIPGCGQMYQGYMRRGVSLLGWFCAVIFIAAILSIGTLGIILPVIWAFAFFDTFNIRNLTPEQRAAFPDEYIPTKNWLQSHNIQNGFLKSKGGSIAGWACIILGLLILYNNFLHPILWELGERFRFISYATRYVPSVLIGILVVVLGVKLLRGAKTPAEPLDMPEEQHDTEDK